MTEAGAEAGSAERRLASFAAGARIEDIPADVLHEAKRSLVNIFATALAGSREPAAEIALTTMAPFSGAGGCSLVGRGERADAPLAAFVNAMAANIHDYDDTHEATVIHPASIVFAALFARAEAAPCSGAELLRAFVLGGEVECRMGNAATPWHYARGWHITSTCGVFGAAAGVGALVGLDEERMLHALGAAAVQSSGLVEALGTMAKSVGVGNAARNGLLSALLAERDFTGPPSPLSGARGWLRVHAEEPDLAALTDGLGSGSPAIRCCASARIGPTCARVGSRRSAPSMRWRSSSGAVARVYDEFSDEAVAETLRTGRPPIELVDEPGRDIASVDLTLRTRDGRELRREIPAARGSRGRPLTDAELEAKLETLADRVGFGGARNLADVIWQLDRLEDAGEVMRLARAD